MNIPVASRTDGDRAASGENGEQYADLGDPTSRIVQGPPSNGVGYGGGIGSGVGTGIGSGEGAGVGPGRGAARWRRVQVGAV